MNNGIEIFYKEPMFKTESIVFWMIVTSIFLITIICVINLAINSFIYDIEQKKVVKKVEKTALRCFQFVLLAVCLTLSVILEHRLYTYLKDQKCIHARIHEDASYRYVEKHYEILEYDAISGICTLKEK